MGLFGFGKKKTSAEILSEGRSQYVKGNLKKALSILRTLADEGNPQACCYVGRIYLELKDKSSAQPYLLTAAKGGLTDAAILLADGFGIRDFLPQKAESTSEAVPPAPENSAQKAAAEVVTPAPINTARENDPQGSEPEDNEEQPDISENLQAPVSETIPESVPEAASESVFETADEQDCESASEPDAESAVS